MELCIAWGVVLFHCLNMQLAEQLTKIQASLKYRSQGLNLKGNSLLVLQLELQGVIEGYRLSFINYL